MSTYLHQVPTVPLNSIKLHQIAHTYKYQLPQYTRVFYNQEPSIIIWQNINKNFSQLFLEMLKKVRIFRDLSPDTDFFLHE